MLVPLPWPRGTRANRFRRSLEARIVRERKSYYRVSIRDITHTGAGLVRKRPRARARVCLCVLDTYRQSEIYVARGESGALKYYRFASRLHIHAWASEDEDGKTEIEREREERRGEA